MLVLAEATYRDVRDLLAREPAAIALLPVGALEAHGPHLPLGTDVIIAEGLARRAGETLERGGRAAAMAPALAYSLTEYAAPFAGTTGVGAEAARGYLRDVLLGLGRAGFARLVVVNAHLEPAHLAVVRAAGDEARAVGRLAIAVPDPTTRPFLEAYQAAWNRRISHADAYETSLVLAERPALVREERTRLPANPSDLVAAMKSGRRSFVEAGGPEAYFGDPAAASLGEGEWLYERLVTLVREAAAALGPATIAP